jgi:hypothetical protein
LAKATGPNQFSLAVGHRATAKVDDCNAMLYAIFNYIFFYLGIRRYKINIMYKKRF